MNIFEIIFMLQYHCKVQNCRDSASEQSIIPTSHFFFVQQYDNILGLMVYPAWYQLNYYHLVNKYLALVSNRIFMVLKMSLQFLLKFLISIMSFNQYI